MDSAKAVDAEKTVDTSGEQPPDQISTTDLPPPPTEFTYFPKLPVELRLKIWMFASHEPRNVDIWVAEAVDGDDESILLESFCHYVSTCPVPSVLQTSQESREEGLKHYKLDFDTTLKMQLDPTYGRRGNVILTSEAQIFVNWKVDRICLMNLSRANSQSLEVLVDKCKKNKLDSLAVGFQMGFISWGNHGRPVFEPHAEWPQRVNLVALKLWDIGLSELILFPYATWTRTSQGGLLPFISERLLREGKIIHFKEMLSSYKGIDRYVKRKLKTIKENLLADIQLHDSRKHLEQIESDTVEQGVPSDVKARKYPKVEICEVEFQKVKGREHWPFNKTGNED